VGLRPWALAATAFAAFFACNVYDKSLLEPAAGPGTDPKNGVGWWSKDDGRGCFTAGLPTAADRPAGDGDGDVGPILVAVDTMRLGSVNEKNQVDINAWKDFGLDLDGVCTASDTCELPDLAPSCKPGAAALPRDGNFCRDNTFGRLEYTASLVPEVSAKYGLSHDKLNCDLCVGHYNFLLRISGYNGKANDDHVRIDLYPSPGLEKPLPWDCTDPTWRTRPCFQPDYPWTIQADKVTEPRGGPDLPTSKIADENAYVREGYLFITMPEDTLFWLPGNKGTAVAYPLRIRKGVVTGKIERSAEGVWRILDGIIAGRTLGEDMKQSFRQIGFCESTDPDNFALMTTFIDGNLDVLGTGASDPNTPCDAMSVGIAFTALQAKAGKLEEVAPLVECQPKGTDGGVDAGSDSSDASLD
jgi:hypothetical protein